MQENTSMLPLSSSPSAVKITASDGQAYDCFGQNVSLDGNTLLVGAAQDDDNGLDSGSAYIFNNTNGVWTEKAKLKPKDGRAGDLFGDTIRLNSNTAFVGSWNRGPGSVYIFNQGRSGWMQTAKLRSSDGKQGDRFGTSFDSTDSGTLLIGGPAQTTKAWIQVVFIFTVKSMAVGQKLAKFMPAIPDRGLFLVDISISMVIRLSSEQSKAMDSNQTLARFIFMKTLMAFGQKQRN